MKKITKIRILLLLVFGLGLLIIAAGFLYDLAYAGIPYQDPPPALQQQYEADQDIAAFIMKLGASIAGPSLCLLLIAMVFKGGSSRS